MPVISAIDRKSVGMVQTELPDRIPVRSFLSLFLKSFFARGGHFVAMLSSSSGAAPPNYIWRRICNLASELRLLADIN